MKFDPSSSTLILLGASEFPKDGGLLPLPAVKNNIHGLREALMDPEICGFLDTRTISLLDPKEISATAKKIEDAAKETTETLLVYYSGHGLVTRHGDFHLALNCSTAESSHFDSLPFSWLKSAILEGNAACRILIIDCCYSGLALGGFMNESESISNFTEMDGSYVLTATQENDLSIARPGEHYSAFTGELIKTIRRGIPNSPPLLDLNSVYVHLRKVLHSKNLPTPDQRSRGTANQLQLIKNKATQKNIIIPTEPDKEIAIAELEDFRNDLLEAFENSPIIQHSAGSWITKDLIRLARNVLSNPFSMPSSPYLPHLDTVSVIACLNHTETDEFERESCPNQSVVNEWKARWLLIKEKLEANSSPYDVAPYPALPARFERHDTMHGHHFKSVISTGYVSTFSWRAFVRHVLFASGEFVPTDGGQLVSSLNPVIRFINRVRRKPVFMLAKKSSPTPTMLRLSTALGMPEWDVLAARIRYLERFNEIYTPDGTRGPLIMSNDFRYFTLGLTFATERFDQLILASRLGLSNRGQDLWQAIYWPLNRRENMNDSRGGFSHVHYYMPESQYRRQLKGD